MNELFVCAMSQRRQTVTWIGSTGKRTRTRGSPFRRKCRSGVVAEALCVGVSLVPTAARYLPLLGGGSTFFPPIVLQRSRDPAECSATRSMLHCDCRALGR